MDTEAAATAAAEPLEAPISEATAQPETVEEAKQAQTMDADSAAAAQAVGSETILGKRTAPDDEPGVAGATEVSEEAPAKKAKGAGSIKLGYRTFQNGNECAGYFKNMLSSLAVGRNMNEYEFMAVLDLLKLGHQNAAQKMGPGVRAFQVREVTINGNTTKCFFVVRTDNTSEDFSYLKCLQHLFPDDNIRQGHGAPRSGSGGHGGSRGGGRGSPGGGSRGRGGRAGRGRGGRGRGGRGR